MKKFIMILALVATSAFAEPSFDQIQGLIGQQQYSAAEQGLEQIIKNHPNSAKAYYSMAQAQAGLGNQDKARYALNKATGLDPTLSFASQSQVRSLQEALTPQVKKIEMIEESHFWRNLVLVLFVFGIGFIIYRAYKKNQKADDDYNASFKPVTPVSPTPSPVRETAPVREITPVAKSEVYKPEAKKEEPVRSYTPPAPSYSSPAPVAHTTVVNNSSNDGLLTGMILGNMMSSHHDHVIEREVIREVPVKSYESPGVRSSTWDSDASSSSWDSDSSSSSSSSSSWSSSSSSDSSWSSSDSSSSSWDSGSSSSDSSW